MKLNINFCSLVSAMTICIAMISCDDLNTNMDRKTNGDVSLGGSVNIAGEEYVSLLPYTINSQQTAQIAVNVLECLTQISPEGKVLPLIAESFEVDNTGLIYKFNIRKGIKFHNDACFSNGEGRELKASDIIYSFQLLCKNVPENIVFSSTFKHLIEGAEEYYNGKAAKVSGFQLIDDYTLLIKTIVKNETLPYILAGVQTSIVPHEAVKRYGNKATVGTGPFIIKHSDNVIKLLRNPRFYLKDEMANQLPYLDEVLINFYKTKAEEIDALFNGNLDMVSGITQDAAKQIMEQHAEDFKANANKFVMESMGYKELFLIRKPSLRGFKINSDATPNWTRAYVIPFIN